MNARQPAQNSMKPGKWIKSTCKMCIHTCNTRVHVTDDGIINKIEGDPDSPSNMGKLCPQGNVAILRHYDPARFTPPLRRTHPECGPGLHPNCAPTPRDPA